MVGSSEMKFGPPVLVIASLFLGLAPMASRADNLDDPVDECAQTAHSQIYSNATFIEEAGDVVGFELALQLSPHKSSVSGLLYDYEGVPNDDGIGLSVHILS